MNNAPKKDQRKLEDSTRKKKNLQKTRRKDGEAVRLEGQTD